MALTTDGGGYWILTNTGTVNGFGDATFYGDLNTTEVMGMSATADGHGYWVLQRSGTVTAFGDAAFYGSGS